MVNVVPREAPRPRDLSRHNIHHDTFKVFSQNDILIASQTSKEGFPSGWFWPMDFLGSPLDIILGLDSKYW